MRTYLVRSAVVLVLTCAPFMAGWLLAGGGPPPIPIPRCQWSVGDISGPNTENWERGVWFCAACRSTPQQCDDPAIADFFQIRPDGTKL